MLSHTPPCRRRRLRSSSSSRRQGRGAHELRQLEEHMEDEEHGEAHVEVQATTGKRRLERWGQRKWSSCITPSMA